MGRQLTRDADHSEREIGSISNIFTQDKPIEESKKLARRKIFIFISIFVALGLLAAVGWTINSWASTKLVVSRERLRIATVYRGQFVRDVDAQGMVVAANNPTLFASATGTVTLLVKAGEAVKKNQILGSVDNPSLTNEYAREQATLESLNAALDHQSIEKRRQKLQNQQSNDLASVDIHAAEREFNRAKEAWDLHIISRHDYERTVDDLDKARVNFQHALANTKLQSKSLDFELEAKKLERNRQQLVVNNLRRRTEELTLRAPIDSIVGNLEIQQKANVAENSPLLNLVDLSTLEVEFRVPESYAGEIRPEMIATITYGEASYAGVVTTVSPEIKQSEVIGRVRFSKPPPIGLRQNQRLSLRIVMESRSNALKVERGAFVDAGGNYTYVINGDIAVRRNIKLGAISVGEVEVVSGLEVGEKIIVSSLSDFNDAPSLQIVK